MSFELYLPRWAAARLLSWWSSAERWGTSSMLAVGRLRMCLRGDARALKPKTQGLIERALAELVAHMQHELAPCCGSEDA